MGDSAYPRDAVREGIDSGEAVMRFTVTASGEIKDITAVSSTNRAFVRAASAAIREFKCIAQGRDVIFEVPFSFKRE
jgi:TonB family protein